MLLGTLALAMRLSYAIFASANPRRRPLRCLAKNVHETGLSLGLSDLAQVVVKIVHFASMFLPGAPDGHGSQFFGPYWIHCHSLGPQPGRGLSEPCLLESVQCVT